MQHKFASEGNALTFQNINTHTTDTATPLSKVGQRTEVLNNFSQSTRSWPSRVSSLGLVKGESQLLPNQASIMLETAILLSEETEQIIAGARYIFIISIALHRM